MLRNRHGTKQPSKFFGNGVNIDSSLAACSHYTVVNGLLELKTDRNVLGKWRILVIKRGLSASKQVLIFCRARTGHTDGNRQHQSYKESLKDVHLTAAHNRTQLEHEITVSFVRYMSSIALVEPNQGQ